MLANIFIIVFSLGLLAFWLRYTCLLLVNDRKGKEEAAFPLFRFPFVRDDLEAGTDETTLCQWLDGDFAVLKYLIKTTSLQDLDARLLVWDYRLLRFWRALSHTGFPARGRQALTEMADVLAALAARLSAGSATRSVETGSS